MWQEISKWMETHLWEQIAIALALGLIIGSIIG